MRITGKIVGREKSDNGLYAYRVVLIGMVQDPGDEVLPMGADTVVEVDAVVSIEVPAPKPLGQLAFEAVASALSKEAKQSDWAGLPAASKQSWEARATEAAATAAKG